MFCAPGLVFGGNECVGSRFLVLRAQTHFRQYRGRRVPFSFFAHPDSFSAIPRVSSPVFMFCAAGYVFGCTECIGHLFHVLRFRTRFRRYRGRRGPSSCFAHPDSFSAVPRASGSVFVFGRTKGIMSRFHVLRSRTRFRQYRGRRVLFSCFALPDSFSAVPRVSGPVFMFCAPRLVFGCTEGVASRFHVLHSRTHFWRYRVRRVPVSCFARPNMFSAVPTTTDLVFIFLAPGHVFGGTEGVGSLFHVLRSQTHF
jgi:hypothetical protein